MRGSIIIPAHNEEQLLPMCLESLARQPGIDEFEIIVVVNGSHDRSAEVAHSVAPRLPGLRVLETPIAGKSQALNLGETHATALPRIYLDADIALSQGAVENLISTLTTDQALVAAPQIRFDTTDSDTIVRRFYEIYRRLPYVAQGLVGLGVYAVSRAGRERFDTFPDIMADDLFVQRLFSADERVTVAGEFVVRAPRRWRDLLAVRIRAAQGARELAATVPIPDMDAATTSTSSAHALFGLIRQHPRLLPAAVIYAGLTLAAQGSARFSRPRWHRDDSSRQAS